MKRRIVWSLVVVLMFSVIGTGSVSAAKIEDVPSDHWAYQAVATLVDKGYLAVYEDGTFQGTRSVDRYTLAVTLARILDEIEAGRIQGSSSDLSLIRELTTEFREELVKWYADREEVESMVTETQKIGKATEERVNRVVAAQVDLQEEVAKIKSELLAELAAEEQARTEAIAAQQDSLSVHEGKIADNLAKLEEQRSRLGELQEALVRLESRFLSQEDTLGGLENWAGEKGAVFAALQAQDAELSKTTNELKQSTKDLEQKSEELSNKIATLKEELRALNAASSEELIAAEEKLAAQIDELAAVQASTDGQFIKALEESRAQIEQLTQRNQELEKDLANLAVRLQRETQSRGDLSDKLQSDFALLKNDMEKQMASLEAQIGLSEDELASLNRQIKDEISLQMNAALIREQRLERQLKELQDEFTGFKTSMEEENKSLKGSATLAMVAAAVGILVGFIK